LQQNVLRLDIAMDHVLSVRIVECRGDLLGKMERIIDWELLLAVQPLAQRLAGDERHDIVEEPVGLARVEQWKDVRVFEAGGELDLAQEPLAADRYTTAIPPRPNSRSIR
jgi:hypothetical protein